MPNDGSTLTLLIDRSCDPTDESPVIHHSIHVPMRPLHHRDRELDAAENVRRFSEQSRIDHSAWTAAVERDPLVRAFMQVDGDH